MGPLLVVEGQISPNPLSGLSPILVCLQVHLLVLDAAPQPFHEDVVHAPAPAVHAHLNALRQQHAGEGLTGELAALVGVEDLWPTLAQGLFQSRNTKVYLQCQGRRDVGPGGRSESVPSEVFGQRKCPCQLFRGSVTETGQLQVGEWVSEDGYWPDLGVF